MRLCFLGLLILIAQTTPLRAQHPSVSPPTGIIQKLPGPSYVRITWMETATGPTDPENGAESPVDAASDKRSSSTSTRTTNERALQPLRDALGGNGSLQIEPIDDMHDSLIVDPPTYIFEGNPDWERFFTAGLAEHRVMRIRLDEWPAHVVHGLLLAPGEILLDGMGNAATAAIAAFRLRHPAVGAGDHRLLTNAAYSFHRSRTDRGHEDHVVIVIGVTGRSSVNVSHAFADDAILREAMTGQTAFVSFGMATFVAPTSGVMLIEEIH